MDLIAWSTRYSRSVVLVLCFILIAGALTYMSIPREAEPDVQIPVLYVVLSQSGVSPEDAERLLVKPAEQELSSVEGVKEMRSTAFQGGGNVILEFEASYDIDIAKADVREKMDSLKSDLPEDAKDPSVHEVNLSKFPIVQITLSGSLPYREMLALAHVLQDSLESIPSVLAAEIGGDRDEVIEVLINPADLEGYDLDASAIIAGMQSTDKNVAAGSMDSENGRLAIDLEGLFTSLEDIQNMPLKVRGDSVIQVGDVATLRRSFKEPSDFAKINGRPTVDIQVSKRVGSNVLETVAEVRAVVRATTQNWPDAIHVDFSQDKSVFIKVMLSQLHNNIASAILLVVIVLVAVLGLRNALLVGISIPGSFLAAILVLGATGLTLNMVVLFSLILAVGMLVDGSIVVTEFADRRLRAGDNRYQAYTAAARRMAWPIIASTLTTLAAFIPLAFWPGLVGKFMKFLPITLIATLSASLFMALVFIPTLGSLFSRKRSPSAVSVEDAHMVRLGPMTRLYSYFLRGALKYPGLVLLAAVLTLICTYVSYGRYGSGIVFFPSVEPEAAQVLVHGRGNLSLSRRLELVEEIEAEIFDMQRSREEFHSIYTSAVARSGTDGQGGALDVIGSINLEFVDWEMRRNAADILAEVADRAERHAGLVVEATYPKGGPPTGKAIQIQLSSDDPEVLDTQTARIFAGLRRFRGLTDLEDGSSPPELEWRLSMHRAQAAKFGASTQLLGNYIKMLTEGTRLSGYRPNNSNEEIDVVAKFPQAHRSLHDLQRIRVHTSRGLVPISNFVEETPGQRESVLKRVDKKRAMTIQAAVDHDVLTDTMVRSIKDWLADQWIDPRVSIVFRGEDEEQKKAQAFLSKAFLVALFLMSVVLITQFNNFYHAFLIMSAVVMSTAGVLIGLLLTDQPFGIIMSGIGVIALAGIVVNNNIVLLDTYQRLEKRLDSVREAILRTGEQRLRPVLLTTITTLFGLLPIVLGINIDFFTREIAFGGLSIQWWRPLSTAIVFGLSFASILTLVVTPCALMWAHNLGSWRRHLFS